MSVLDHVAAWRSRGVSFRTTQTDARSGDVFVNRVVYHGEWHMVIHRLRRREGYAVDESSTCEYLRVQDELYTSIPKYR